MTAQATLRAALDKHQVTYRWDDFIDDGAGVFDAILEAMAQHRAEAIEELEKWVKDQQVFVRREFAEARSGSAALIVRAKYNTLEIVEAHLLALKTQSP